MSTWTAPSCLDSDSGNFALQASDALSPNATSDFQLLLKNAGSLAMQVCSMIAKI